MLKETFIIAEVGINHGGSLAEAIKLIDAANEAGANSVKFQTYITEKRVPKDSPIFDILKACELSFEEQQELFEYGRQAGIEIFSTPFDEESVDFLETQNCPIYKVASFDSVNHKLLQKIAALKKRTIISTGMTTEEELDKALSFFSAEAIKNVSVLHCISSYPLEKENANLAVIGHLKKLYPYLQIGYSDHSIGTEVPVFAVAAGANIIEKHFTLDTKADGPDHALSADPRIMAEMVKHIRSVEKILGKTEMGVRPAETDIVPFRRATYA